MQSEGWFKAELSRILSHIGMKGTDLIDYLNILYIIRREQPLPHQYCTISGWIQIFKHYRSLLIALVQGDEEYTRQLAHGEVILQEEPITQERINNLVNTVKNKNL
jgi:hypothetical protein